MNDEKAPYRRAKEIAFSLMSLRRLISELQPFKAAASGVGSIFALLVRYCSLRRSFVLRSSNEANDHVAEAAMLVRVTERGQRAALVT